MVNDIMRPPRRPNQPPVRPPQPALAQPAPEPVVPPAQESPAANPPQEPVAKPPKKSLKKKILALLAALLLIGLLAIGGVVYWYQSNLQPANPDDERKTVVRVVSGMTTQQIANLLEEKSLIKSADVFSWYIRLQKVSLQAGVYQVSPADSVSEIATHLASGKTDTIAIMFYPGGTLRDMTRRPSEPKVDAKSVLLRAGYKDEDIEAAFAKQYEHPLFKDKPASADLEGYIMAETFYVDAHSTVEEVLKHTFDVYYRSIQENGIEAGLKSKGFNLYQGITLASIIQKEVNNEPEQRQVAQVFLKRLSIDMSLGSDPTFIYAARKTGAAEVPTLDSPYNTRIHRGLPPGPIASPSIMALKSILNPAPGDYLYFVAGEDGNTYFSYTEAEHNKNIVEHCKSLCQ